MYIVENFTESSKMNLVLIEYIGKYLQATLSK